MKIENKPFTFFDYLDSVKRQKDHWIEEAKFQQSQSGDIAVQLYAQATQNAYHLETEVKRLTKILEC